MILPPEAAPLLAALTPAFTQPTATRFTTLLAAAILTTGRRTTANLLRTLGCLATGHTTTYQRVLSEARWSGLALGCALTRLLLTIFCPDGVVRLIADDTVDGHKGKCVYGKARHRDPVRSTKTYTAWRYGHRWVVLAVLVRIPLTTRQWALPILADLYRCAEQDRIERRPHRTPTQLVCRLLRLLLIRFPDRTFSLVADSTYGTHELARFCHRHRDRLTLISKLHPAAALYEPPPPYTGRGRRRIKGDRLPSPQEVVAATRRRRRLTVGWYGGGTRQVAVVTRTGRWYRVGRGAIPLRWVHVQDRTGTHRPEYLFSTDPILTPAQIITSYTTRWNIETTFQECRAYLGLGTTCGWCERTVLRAAPCLLGLYSAVAVLFDRLPERKRRVGVRWRGKVGVTFSDALASVRRWAWAEAVFPRSGGSAGLRKLPRRLRELVMQALTPAA